MEIIRKTATLQYDLSYANARDFSNAAILNEIGTFDFAPFNKKYGRLPNKMVSVRVTKDQAGNVLTTDNSTAQTTINYNSYGFVSIISTTAGYLRHFIYNH